MAISEKPKCGTCIYFDPNRRDGTPVGTIGGQVLGLCRAEKGLAVGQLTLITSCRLREGVYRPLSSASAPK